MTSEVRPQSAAPDLARSQPSPLVRDGELPKPDDDPAWTIRVEGLDPELERVHEALLSISDGRVGTAGAPTLGDAAARPAVFVEGAYDGSRPESRLLAAPLWDRLEGTLAPGSSIERRLDLRTGLLFERIEHEGTMLESCRFASAARPGTCVLLARGDPRLIRPGPALRRPEDSGGGGGGGETDGISAVSVRSETSEINTSAWQEWSVASDRIQLTRIAAYAKSSPRQPSRERSLRRLRAARDAGVERLIRETRSAWASRWADADVVVEGDPELQRDVRFALFHLMASVADTDEAVVGARGLSGPGYAGHVFWDSDVFVLPFLAATHPSSARAMLEYRIRRLPAALGAARALGREGARFPWEAASSGRDVTPTSARDRSGRIVPIRTGQLEEHIVADVAWAANCYVEWTGDEAFLLGAGRPLLVETARYWASRVRWDREGRCHIYGVIGPDEYHEPVDDDAFTNVMARWNLRRAAALPDEAAISEFERLHWMETADALVDGYDPRTKLYEQFAGFNELEPLIIADVAPRRPIAADLLLGRDRVARAQVIKQADVLMLHHLVPDEVVADSLLPNLDFYEPRTAHGSSLSPPIHAALLARAGRLDDAVSSLRVASRIDLDDLTGTTAAGLHLASMGGVWQALAFGFAGLRPRGDALSIDPHLPKTWPSLRVRARFRGLPVHIHMTGNRVHLTGGRVTVMLGERRAAVEPPGVWFERSGEGWREVHR